MESVINEHNFEKICRTCLRFTENLTAISLLNIIEMLRACSSIQIYLDDKLPKNVCDQCMGQLQAAYDFKNQCEHSDNQLRKILEREEKFNCEEMDSKVKIEFNHEFNSDVEYDADSIKSEGIEVEPESIQTGSKNKVKLVRTKKKANKRYECEICNHKFSETWKLGIHMKRVHRVEGTKCSKCSFICYHKLHLEVHERSHIEMKVFCDVCNKGFINRRKLKHHKISHSTERPHHCQQCDASFKARFILTKHVKTVHADQEHEVCPVCGKNVRKSYLERHLKIHEERSPYPCSECPKKFSLEKSLEIHFKRVHQNEQINYCYLCNVCGRSVISRAELKRHIRSHTGEKPFACDKCDKRYARTGALNHHIKTAHLDMRPCVCSVCSQAFHSKNILQNHMRKHTGERPYSCLICGKSFGFRSVLRTHMKIHST